MGSERETHLCVIGCGFLCGAEGRSGFRVPRATRLKMVADALEIGF